VVWDIGKIIAHIHPLDPFSSAIPECHRTFGEGGSTILNYNDRVVVCRYSVCDPWTLSEVHPTVELELSSGLEDIKDRAKRKKASPSTSRKSVEEGKDPTVPGEVLEGTRSPTTKRFQQSSRHVTTRGRNGKNKEKSKS